jgi:hypothetical protein
MGRDSSQELAPEYRVNKSEPPFRYSQQMRTTLAWTRVAYIGSSKGQIYKHDLTGFQEAANRAKSQKDEILIKKTPRYYEVAFLSCSQSVCVPYCENSTF